MSNTDPQSGLVDDIKTQLTTMTSTVYSQMKDIDSLKAILKELISFLEYEEAYTVDTRTQQRIGAKLKKLKIWPK